MAAKPLFLFSKPRSGTSVLGKTLQAAGVSDYLGEPLNSADPGNFYEHLKAKILAGQPTRLDDTLQEFIEYVHAACARSTMPYLLFDVKYEQFPHLAIPWGSVDYPAAVIRAAAKLNAAIIQLVRTNFRERIFSNEVAAATGVYHVANDPAAMQWRDKTLSEDRRIRIEPAFYAEKLRRESLDHLWVFRAMSAIQCRFVQVEYERLFAPEATVEKKFEWGRLLRHLDSPVTAAQVMALEPPLVKVAPKGYGRHILNEAELAPVDAQHQHDDNLRMLKALAEKRLTAHALATPPSKAHERLFDDLVGKRRVHENDFNYFAQLPAAPCAFIDIGANIGTSMLSAHFVQPGWRTLSFEPNAGNFTLLDRAAAFVRSEGATAEVFHYGLSDAAGETTLYVPVVDRWYVVGEASVDIAHFNMPAVQKRLASYSTHGEWDLVPVGIVLKVFDELPAELNDPPEPHVVVKIDVEGHELEVLRGMTAFIRRRLPIFMIENDGTRGIESYLSGFGYQRKIFKQGALVDPAGAHSLNSFFLPPGKA